MRLKTGDFKLTQEIAKRLCSLRVEAGITQTLAAEFAGESLSAYRSHEGGLTSPTIFALRKYAEVFRVSTDYLLGLTDRKM